MNAWRIRFRGAIGIAVALSTVGGMAHPARAEYFYAYAIVQRAGGDETTGLGMPLVIESATVGGIETGFYLGRANLALDFLFGSTDITMEGDVIGTKLFFVDVNVDFVVLARQISPLLTAGIGSVNFADSHVGAELFNETDFSYNIGAGLCARIADRFLAKAVYRATWTTLKETDKAVRFDGISAGLGYAF